jgi:peptidoglycan-N-acetylglucosamine deacetylase
MKKLWVLGCVILLCLTACTSTPSGTDAAMKHPKRNTSEVKKDKPEKTEPVSQTTGKDDTQQEQTQAEKQQQIRYEVDPKTWSVKPIVANAPKNVVLLTIDDAPDKHALEMATTLKELNAKAIFFLNGHFLTTDQKKKTVKTLVDMGFMLGDHTYSHAYLPDLSPAEQEKEILSVYDQIKEITGKPPLFFRAPNGANTDTSRKLSQEKGMVLMNWSYGYDWNKEYENKEAITKIMINSPYLHNGAILLMHDRPWTAEALKDIVIGLRHKGYVIMDPHELKTLQ